MSRGRSVRTVVAEGLDGWKGSLGHVNLESEEAGLKVGSP